MVLKKRATHRRSVSLSLKEYARGIAGGLLFSLPLLYTMELWNAGHVARPSHLILYLFVIFGLLLGYNRYAGMRRDANFREVAVDSVEEMGLGLVLAVVILWFSGRITATMPVSDVLGQTLIAAMTVAVGVSVGTAQLGAEEDEPYPDTGAGSGEEKLEVGGQVTIALCGAVLFAANIGPTEEITAIALGSSSSKLLGLAVGSIVLGAVILFYSNFYGAGRVRRMSRLESVLVEAVITYAVAIAVSAAILGSLGRFQGLPAIACIAQIVVLGLPASLGASAGRLLLQRAE